MSHITRIKTVMVEKQYLLKALQSMGYQVQERARSIVTDRGRRKEEELRVQPPRSCEISFRKVGQTYQVAADWDGVRGINRKEFVSQVVQRYSYYAAVDKLKEQGFEVASEQVNQDRQIQIILRRTV